MKKVFKLISNILLIAAVALFCLAGLFSAILATDQATLVVCTQFLTVLLVGAFLRYAKNKIASRIGEGLLLTGVVANTISCFGALINSMDVGLPTILTLIAFILYCVAFIFKLILYIIDKNNEEYGIGEDPNSNPKFNAVRAWKSLVREGIITEEEFETKRVEILGLAPTTDEAVEETNVESKK